MLNEKEIAAMISRMKSIYEDQTMLNPDTKILAVIALCELNNLSKSLYGEEVHQDFSSEQRS